MKRRPFLLAFALILSCTGAVMSKGRFAFRYIDSINPNQCLWGGTLPSNCTNLPQNPAVVCVTPLGTSHTRTYYQWNTCVSTYYRLPE